MRFMEMRNSLARVWLASGLPILFFNFLVNFGDLHINLIKVNKKVKKGKVDSKGDAQLNFEVLYSALSFF